MKQQLSIELRQMRQELKALFIELHLRPQDTTITDSIITIENEIAFLSTQYQNVLSLSN